MKFYHFSDIHFKPLQRHEEYKEGFQHFIDSLNGEKVDRIVITGDIVDKKTQRITPEIIDILVWFFDSISKVAEKVDVILGNHDGNLKNAARQDAISPILTALNLPNINLYKKSGTYHIKDKYYYCVYSCFDEEGWQDVKPVDGSINIALFHGSVAGATTDLGYELPSEVEKGFFSGCDFVLLGDIHKHQFLNKEQTMAYPGSTFQQNFGESVNRHGYMIWDIKEDKSYSTQLVEIPNKKPFITIDWKDDVQNIVKSAQKYPNESRFRIRKPYPLSKKHEQYIINELKKSKNSSHVVFDYEKRTANQKVDLEMGSFKRNLRNSNVIVGLLKDFFEKDLFDEGEWKDIEEIIRKYIDTLPDDGVKRHTQWVPYKLEFSNIMQYGENNVINFKKFYGVTGIFAPNRYGKSTIIAALSYVLYGKIDRKINQNHYHGVINERKQNCSAELLFTVSGCNYKIKRKTERKKKKDGRLGASNELYLWEMDSQWNEVKPLHDIVGKETDKFVKNLIGDYEDFKLTALASQKDISRFINENSTERKKILSRFRELHVLNDLHKMSSNSLKESKTLLKDIKVIDWDQEIEDLSKEKDNLKKNIDHCEKMMDVLRDAIKSEEENLYKNHNTTSITKQELEEKKEILDKLKKNLKDYKKELEEKTEEKTEIEHSLEKTRKQKENIDIESVRAKLKKRNKLAEKLSALKQKLSGEEKTLSNKKNIVKKLDLVPCGDKYPTCMYIKDAHKEKSEIEKQNKIIEEVRQSIQSVEMLLVDEDDYQSKIKEYDILTSFENKLYKKISEFSLDGLKGKISNCSEKIDNKLAEYKEALLQYSEEEDQLIKDIKDKISEMKKELKDFDIKKISNASRIGRIEADIDSMEKEKKKYLRISKYYHIYEELVFALGKKGIQNQILRKDLPALNSEIESTLSGIVPFGVVLDLEEESDKLEVYLESDGNLRPIELCSGMEQVVASLAVRVGLLNASNLPKPDFMILDEPFEGVDGDNVDNVVSMISGLKKWFKNIFLITHLDSIKDSADDIIEIERKHNEDSYVCEDI